jgi:hypothetical protein
MFLYVFLGNSIAKSLRFGLNFKGQVRSYHVNTTLGGEEDRYLVRSANDIYTYMQYGTKSGIHFQLGFGRSMGRSYRMYNQTVTMGMPLVYFGDNRAQLNSDFSDSWLLKLAVFYRLKLGDK